MKERDERVCLSIENISQIAIADDLPYRNDYSTAAVRHENAATTTVKQSSMSMTKKEQELADRFATRSFYFIRGDCYVRQLAQRLISWKVIYQT